MKRSRVDIWCRDLGIRGDARKLLILFADKGEATIEEMIECLREDDPDGGPELEEGALRTTLHRLRKRLAGRAEISRRSVYEIRIPGTRNR